MGGDGVRAGVGCDGDALGMGMCWGWRNAVPAAHPTAPPDGFGGGSGGWGGSVRQIPPPLYSLMMSGERAMKGNCRAALCHPTRRADRSQCERSMSPPSHSPRAPRGVRGGAWGGGHKAESPQVWGGDGEGARCAHPPPSSQPRSPPTPHPSACRAAPAAPRLPYQCFCSTGCGTRTHTCAPECTRGEAESPWVCAECNARLWVGRQHCTAVRAPYPTHRTTALQPRVHRRATHACVQCTNRALGGWGVDVCWGGAVLGVTAEGPAALRVPPPIWFAGGGADGRSHRMERRGRRAAVTLDPHHPPTHSTAAAATTGGGRAVWGGRSPRSLSCHPPPRPSLAPGD